MFSISSPFGRLVVLPTLLVGCHLFKVAAALAFLYGLRDGIVSAAVGAGVFLVLECLLFGND